MRVTNTSTQHDIKVQIIRIAGLTPKDTSCKEQKQRGYPPFLTRLRCHRTDHFSLDSKYPTSS